MEPQPHTTYKNGLKTDQTLKTIKLLEENVNLPDLGSGYSFLNKTPKVQKQNAEKLDFIKIKNFSSSKDGIENMKRQATEWEKIFVSRTSDKVLVSRIFKELL